KNAVADEPGSALVAWQDARPANLPDALPQRVEGFDRHRRGSGRGHPCHGLHRVRLRLRRKRGEFADGPARIGGSAELPSRPWTEIGPRLTGDPPHVDRVKSRSEEHTSELQSRSELVCRLL